MGFVNKFIRAVTFSLGVIIAVFFLHYLGLNIFPPALMSELGFGVLVVFLIAELRF